jgi:hypothetical protein
MASRDKAPDLEKTKGFLSRWSQRKREAEEEAAAGAVEAPQGDAGPQRVGASDAAEVPAADGDPEWIDPRDLPDIDTLDAGSDFSAFMKDGVPQALKQRALRKLWHVDPAFREICMLDDYNLDYTDAATVMPNMKTLYQVGRGMVLPEEEKAEQEALEKLAAQEAELARVPVDDVSEHASDDATDGTPDARAAEPGDEAEATAAALPPEEAPPPDAAAPKKRQRNPGDPVVTGAATRRSDTARPAARSARSRRWGDSDHQ